MATHILQISYEIDPQRRTQFLALASDLKAHFAGELKKHYAIFEVKGKPNAFVEQFVCGSKEEFDALEDDMTERGEELVSRHEQFMVGGKARYVTMVEV